ncbi:DNA polymerase III subunit beta [Spirochaetia bacterium]|nr:DNA polymerase III subunit beta [Spirochaetia bacterium]
MKFSCERAMLQREIAFAQEIIASKNVNSMLSNIFLEADGEYLNIKATDIKVNFETKLIVRVDEPGSTTVFCDKVLRILSTLPDGEMEFEDQDSILSIRPLGARTKKQFKLKTLSPEQFPELPEAPEDKFFQIPVSEFKEMINQTIFSVSNDDTRYFMTGSLFLKTEGKFIMVATDGRRMAYIDKPAEEDIPDFEGVIIPPKILQIVAKHTGDEGLIFVAITEKIIFIQFGLYHLSSALIDGSFPNWKRVIPESQESVVSFNRQDLLDAIRSVSILIEHNATRTYLKIKPRAEGQPETIFVYSEEGESGTAEAEIPCTYEKPEETTIAINYRYFVEPLRVMSTDEAEIHFTDPTKALTLNPSPEDNLFHIIMPMQV